MPSESKGYDNTIEIPIALVWVEVTTMSPANLEKVIKFARELGEEVRPLADLSLFDE